MSVDHSPPQRLCSLLSFYETEFVFFLSISLTLGSSGLGREVGKRGSKGASWTFGAATARKSNLYRKKTNYKASAEESVR
jgi:hypothetical protein